jgi:hypothetical protein
MERTKKRAGITRKKQPRGGKRAVKRVAALCEGKEIVRDAAWEREKRWFEENRSLDPLALFAKYYQRL